MEKENMESAMEKQEAELYQQIDEYWRNVAESDGFDVKGLVIPAGTSGLLGYDCLRPRARYPYDVLVKLYARLGLHRYNLLEGASFELLSLVKFNKLLNCTSSYYITLLANDGGSSLMKTFQVRVDEKAFGYLDLTCSVARLENEVTPKRPFVPHLGGGGGQQKLDGFDYDLCRLPDWPSDDTLDDNGFYLLKKSEYPDWIYLYLELLLCCKDRTIAESVLSRLVIVKVVMKSVDNAQPLDKMKRATFYITFKGLEKANIGEIGKHVERLAIIRRDIHESTGDLTLRGAFSSGE